MNLFHLIKKAKNDTKVTKLSSQVQDFFRINTVNT